MNDTNDVRLPDATGAVLSEPEEQHKAGLFQPDVQPEGSSPIRKRKADASVNHGGHRVTGGGAVTTPYDKHDEIALGSNLAQHKADETHVHAPTPEAKAHERYISDRRAEKDRTFASPSGRKPLTEMLKK
jgi:hypothetical protein